MEMETEASPVNSFWSASELELFERAKRHEEFTRNPVWKQLKESLDLLVEDAQAEMRMNRSPKAGDAFKLQLYWREREHVRDLIMATVFAPIRDRDAIIEDLKQQQRQKIEEEQVYARRSETNRTSD